MIGLHGLLFYEAELSETFWGDITRLYHSFHDEGQVLFLYSPKTLTLVTVGKDIGRNFF